MRISNFLKLSTLCCLLSIGITNNIGNTMTISDRHDIGLRTQCFANNRRQYLCIKDVNNPTALQHDTVIQTYNRAFRYNKAAKSIFCYNIDPVIINHNTSPYTKNSILRKFDEIQQKRKEYGLDSNDVITDTNEKVKELFGNDFYIKFDISEKEETHPNMRDNGMLREVRQYAQQALSKLVTVVKDYPIIPVHNNIYKDNLIVVTNNKDAYCIDYNNNQIRVYGTATGNITWTVDQVLPKLNELCTYIDARMMQEEEILCAIFGHGTQIFY